MSCATKKRTYSELQALIEKVSDLERKLIDKNKEVDTWKEAYKNRFNPFK